jgi:uncharacterized protein YdhG (YjbR/CyaY superfamily)
VSDATNVVDVHLDAFTGRQRAALDAVRATLRSALPGATEAISYGIPTMQIDDVSVIGFEGYTKHNSIFPFSNLEPLGLADELAAYPQTKGSVHFAVDRPFPAGLLRRLVRARIEQINASYPKRGEVKEFHANGFLKMRGRMRGDEMHGAWEWFRSDGTRLRSGSFNKGARVGEWVDYDRAGEPSKVTTIAAEPRTR